MVSDQQVKRLWRQAGQALTLEIAAAKAGMDPKTARKYLRDRRLPSEMRQKHTWRTRPDWHRSGVPLECVERATLLGCLRKYVTFLNHGSGTPITTLGYFRSLIDEIDQLNASPDYWQYVAIRLTALERRWSRQHDRPSRGRDPEKTE